MQTNFNVSSVKGGNTGSSGNLTNYLDKELSDNWFDANEQGIKTDKVKTEIDRYGKGQLGANDWKFVEIEYCPSKKEQEKIISKATGRTDVTNWNQLNKDEQVKVKDEFASYIRDAQDLQAKNYNRDNIKSGADLKYYAKIETQRKYKGTDDAVKNGTVKQGDLKEGLHLHAHIIQSRKAENKKTKLSPLTNSKGATKNNPIKQGFNRSEFYKKAESLFDEKFNHKRDVKESYEWQNANKYNRREEKLAIEKRAEQKEVQTVKEVEIKSTEQSRATPEPQLSESDIIDKSISDFKQAETDYKTKTDAYNKMIKEKTSNVIENSKALDSDTSSLLVDIKTEHKRIVEERTKSLESKKEELEKVKSIEPKSDSFFNSKKKSEEIKGFNRGLENKIHSLEGDIVAHKNSDKIMIEAELNRFSNKLKTENNSELFAVMKSNQKTIQEKGVENGFNVVEEIKKREIIKQDEQRKLNQSKNRGNSIGL